MKSRKTIIRRLVELAEPARLVVLGFLVFLGCSSDEVERPQQMQQRAVGFSARIAENKNDATRGARTTRTAPEPGDGELTTALLQTVGFGVYCWYTGSTDVTFTNAKGTTPSAHISTYTRTLLMQNQRVTYSNSKWDYTPSKYWPLNSSEKLTFRAYAPYVSYELQTSDEGMPLLPVVVTADDYKNGSQHDPLWGTSRHEGTDDEGTTYGTLYNNYTYANSGDHYTDPVGGDARNGFIDWYFHHGMTRLIFQCFVIQEPGCDSVTIKSITVSDLYTRGLLNISSPTASSAITDKPIWTERGGSMTVNIEEDYLASKPLVIRTDMVPPTVSDTISVLGKGLLIIPRAYNELNPLTVTITYTIDEDDTELTAEGIINDREFYGNTSYTLNMKLTPTTQGLDITLVQSAFTPWKDGGSGTHTVYNW